MMNLCCEVLKTLKGKTLGTAESCTGGGIGAAMTSVPGSSSVFKGGVICYCNEIKHVLLNVPEDMLIRLGAVSAPVAEAMARGAREVLKVDVAVSVTGLAGPDGDEFGNPVGTVYIGYSDATCVTSQRFLFTGDRESVRNQAVKAALELLLVKNK